MSDNNSNDTTKQTVTTAQSESNKTDKSAISNQTTKSTNTNTNTTNTNTNTTNTNTNTTNTKNDTKESAKVESAQVNDSSNNQVSTFRSVAKPRMMYATAKKQHLLYQNTNQQ